jgi:hypothetical protein
MREMAKNAAKELNLMDVRRRAIAVRNQRRKEMGKTAKIVSA